MKAEFLFIVSIVGESSYMQLEHVSRTLIVIVLLHFSYNSMDAICLGALKNRVDYYYDASMKKPIVNLQIRRTWEGGQEYITRGV